MPLTPSKLALIIMEEVALVVEVVALVGMGVLLVGGVLLVVVQGGVLQV